MIFDIWIRGLLRGSCSLSLIAYCAVVVSTVLTIYVITIANFGNKLKPTELFKAKATLSAFALNNRYSAPGDSLRSVTPSKPLFRLAQIWKATDDADLPIAIASVMNMKPEEVEQLFRELLKNDDQ